MLNYFVLVHEFRASNPGAENDRTMEFYNEARVDGIMKRVETPTEMTEEYKDREDCLYYTNVEFGKRAKRFGPQDSSAGANARPIHVSFPQPSNPIKL